MTEKMSMFSTYRHNRTELHSEAGENTRGGWLRLLVSWEREIAQS